MKTTWDKHATFFKTEEGEIRVGRIIGVSVLAMILLWVVGCTVNLLAIPGHVVSNTIQTTHGVIDRTINADNAIYNYEWFKQQYQDIRAVSPKLEAARQSLADFKADAGDPATWAFDTRQEASRLNSIVLGLRNQRSQMIADYNAHASEANRDLFRTGDLPDFIDN